MFPITYKNRFIYNVQGDPRWAADKLRDHLAQGLAKEGARNVVARDTIIRFDGNPWAFFRWHFFHMISKGKITVDYRHNQLGVVYQISFIDHFVMFLVMIGFWIFGLLTLFRLPLSGGLIPILVMPFFWPGLLIYVSVAINYYRFNRFVKHRLREFFDSAARFGVQGELITLR